MRRLASLLPACCWLSCAAATAESPSPLAASAVAAPAATHPTGPVASPAPAPVAALPDPDWLPTEAKEMLHARMDRHGEVMMLLLVSVLTLHQNDTELLAEQVAAEPRLGRPGPAEKGTLNALLPTRFFGLQDELTERAHALAEAARASDHGRIVRAYGRLAETCVSCHSVYLTPDSPFELPGD